MLCLFRLIINNASYHFFLDFAILIFLYLLNQTPNKKDIMKTNCYAFLPDGTKVFIISTVNELSTDIGKFPPSAKVKRPLYNMGGKYIGDSVFYVDLSLLTLID